MEKKLRIGIIGTGTMAQRHIGALRTDPRVDLCAVCDQNLERAQGVARQYGVPGCYGDYRELLKDESIDAVTVVTPTFTHKTIVLDALQAGKHVMCEKPPALTVQDTQACIDAARAAGKLLMYGFVYRFNQNIRFLKDYVDSGAMGDIYAVDVTRVQRCSQLGGWFVDKSRSGGGQLMDAAIHQVDAALYLMGRPAIKSVKGYATDVNSDLPEKAKGLGGTYASADHRGYHQGQRQRGGGQPPGDPRHQGGRAAHLRRPGAGQAGRVRLLPHLRPRAQGEGGAHPGRADPLRGLLPERRPLRQRGGDRPSRHAADHRRLRVGRDRQGDQVLLTKTFF